MTLLLADRLIQALERLVGLNEAARQLWAIYRASLQGAEPDGRRAETLRASRIDDRYRDLAVDDREPQI